MQVAITLMFGDIQEILHIGFQFGEGVCEEGGILLNFFWRCRVFFEEGGELFEAAEGAFEVVGEVTQIGVRCGSQKGLILGGEALFRVWLRVS